MKETFQNVVVSTEMILKHIKQKLTQLQGEMKSITATGAILAGFSQTLTDKQVYIVKNTEELYLKESY